MRKCTVDGKNIGPLTGYVKISDGTCVCRNHWKSMQFNTTTDPVKFSPLLTSEDVHTIILKEIDGHAFIEEKTGQHERQNKIQRQLDGAGVSDLWGTKKEVKALSEIIKDNETIKYATSGVVEGNTVLMVCTDRRVLFIDKGFIYGIKSTEIPLKMINAISYSKGLLLGSITITNGATTTQINNVSKETALLMVQSVNDACEAVSHQKQPVPPVDTQVTQTFSAQIRELKSLVDDGIITQDEFDAKKKQILKL